MSSLHESDFTQNNQLAFDLLEKEYGIAPVMHASDMSGSSKIDQLSMVVYLTQIRNALTEKDVPAGNLMCICVFLLYISVSHESLKEKIL